MNPLYDSIRAIFWREDGLYLLDQRKLPQQKIEIHLLSASAVADAIRDMVVRGAPAIGITAAYGVVTSAIEHQSLPFSSRKQQIIQDILLLSESRPTAVNLFWALDKMKACLESSGADQHNLLSLLLNQARQIHEDDLKANYRMAEYGAALLQSDAAAVLTHCNAGALATGGYGTALGVIRRAYSDGKIQQVFADETRPWMQGARLTAWEFVEEQIPVTLLCEGAAASLMAQGSVSWVIVGSDRIAANGDVANKIGTYALAILARHHGVKFMVAAPTSTIDMQTASGKDIPIEQRELAEVFNCGHQRVATEGAMAWNPAFDVTPAELVDAIVTEKGVIEKPDFDKMTAHMAL
ncbi:MAG: S-methyl-5-thioribose-1-phosphate isomerase [Gammaproteobacteria bacterium]|nr:S-methyl-5-thioribose-1-phosphate isomerase [Gammaproteobacteria bacterium]